MSKILILSGGLDSTTLLYDLKQKGDMVYALSFNYGQRHKRELKQAAATCNKLDVPHMILNISDIADVLDSALTTSGITIPEGHYESENMKVTVVPNRNLIMLAIAAGYAHKVAADSVYIAAHSGDHAIYPDCRASFFECAEAAINIGSYTNITIQTPYLELSKSDIVQRGIALDVDFTLTQTCYNGEEKACGKCGSCRERLEAFAANKLTDPIVYT
jgi:7-cyano-7-deazaguanine synthase